MAQNLNKTKRRIDSIKSTKKITKAMELIAQVKLKRYKDIMLKGENYTLEISNLILDLLSSRKEEEKSIYELDNNATKDLVIVVTSNLGLCAGYNNDIYKYVTENVSKEKTTILVIGQKGDDYFKKEGYEVDESFYLLNEKIEYNEVSKLANYIDSLFRQEKYHTIKLIYTHYVNSIKFVPNMKVIYPIKLEDKGKIKEYPPIFDPDLKTLIDSLIPIYINSSLYQYIVESQVSEQASRREAMENANDNADELIETLTLEYNKARQANITQEITEVTSASLGGK